MRWSDYWRGALSGYGATILIMGLIASEGDPLAAIELAFGFGFWGLIPAAFVVVITATIWTFLGARIKPIHWGIAPLIGTVVFSVPVALLVGNEPMAWLSSGALGAASGLAFWLGAAGLSTRYTFHPQMDVEVFR